MLRRKQLQSAQLGTRPSTSRMHACHVPAAGQERQKTRILTCIVDGEAYGAAEGFDGTSGFFP